MNRNTNEWIGWWTVWLRRRDIDEYRAWTGRRGRKHHYVSTDQEAGEYLLPSTAFEGRLVTLLDFEVAWPLLSRKQQILLLLTVEGLNDRQIGELFGKSQNAIAGQKKRARRILRRTCEVRY